jgi:hypothetical protein
VIQSNILKLLYVLIGGAGYMDKAILKFAAALLLLFIIIIRKQKGQKGLTTFIENKLYDSDKERLTFETWISKIGFVYLVLGEFIQVVYSNSDILKLKYEHPIIRGILVVLAGELLAYMAIVIAKNITDAEEKSHDSTK